MSAVMKAVILSRAYPGSLVLMPTDSERARLLDASFTLLQEAAGLGASLHPNVKAEVGDLVRAMNCYYSNLIEGHNTLPRDIERALANDFSTEPRKRDLQLEARAHIEVQSMIDKGQMRGLGFGRDFVRTLHREFCQRLPRDLLTIEDPRTTTMVAIEPGAWRTREVEVGRHRPIEADMVESFMLHFEEGYDPNRVGKAGLAIAAAASHHRLLWIHPFIDGNGRVARLHSHAYLSAAGIGSEVWSVARGLARSVQTYRELLERADYPPQGARDGRGTLSDKNLVEFVDFFLKTALDQVRFMHGLLQPATLIDRIRGFVAAESDAKRLDRRVLPVLERSVVAGQVEKAAISRLLGVEERQSRRLLEPLTRRGLLKADAAHGPMRIAFPLSEADALFPRLFAPAC